MTRKEELKSAKGMLYILIFMRVIFSITVMYGAIIIYDWMVKTGVVTSGSIVVILPLVLVVIGLIILAPIVETLQTIDKLNYKLEARK